MRFSSSVQVRRFRGKSASKANGVSSHVVIASEDAMVAMGLTQSQTTGKKSPAWLGSGCLAIVATE